MTARLTPPTDEEELVGFVRLRILALPLWQERARMLSLRAIRKAINKVGLITDMKAMLYLDDGSKWIVDIITPVKRKERETQGEFEQRVTEVFNASQPGMIHKVKHIKLMRN